MLLSRCRRYLRRLALVRLVGARSERFLPSQHVQRALGVEAVRIRKRVKVLRPAADADAPVVHWDGHRRREGPDEGLTERVMEVLLVGVVYLVMVMRMRRLGPGEMLLVELRRAAVRRHVLVYRRRHQGVLLL